MSRVMETCAGPAHKRLPPITERDVIDQFREAIASAGLVPPDTIEADGTLHRFASDGRRGDDSGYYVLHLDGVPVGMFGCWRSGLRQTWHAKSHRKPTREERSAYRERIEAMHRQRQADEAERQRSTADWARRLWRDSTPALADHPYLVTKCVKPYGLRASGDELLVPMASGGEIVNLQRITTTGEKRFLPGGRVKACYLAIGTPDRALLISEGYATAASVHEATGAAVAVAFSAGNLSPVAEALRTKFPELRIVICGDNDANGTGQRSAMDAARAIGALVAIPATEGHDWNDVHKAEGLDAVRAGIEAARTPEPGSSAEPATLRDETARAILVRGDTIQPQPIEWLWDGWLAAGKLHILAGAPGTGKTTLALGLAATVTSGGMWPDRTRAERGEVVMWSGEDSPEDVLVPRVLAMGADTSRIHFVQGVTEGSGRRPYDPARDTAALAAAIAGLPRMRLLIVDPIVSAVAGDSHHNAETRRSLQPLVDMAQARGCALIGITHLSKGSAGRDPVERVTGSLAFGALARVVLLAAREQTEEDKPGRRLLLRAKSNIGPDAGGIAYDLTQRDLPGYATINASCVLWGDPVDGTARELMQHAEQVDDGAADDSNDFLRHVLSDGARSGP